MPGRPPGAVGLEVKANQVASRDRAACREQFEDTPSDSSQNGTGIGMELRTEPRLPHVEFFPPPPPPRGPSVWLERLTADHRELMRFWPVVQNMVVQELRVRYQRSILGFVWTLLNPLLMMCTLSVVFSYLVTRVENYPLFLFAGMVPWTFLSTSISESAYCIIQNENLIKKIYLPKLIFPLVRVLIGLVTFVLSLSALFVLLWTANLFAATGLTTWTLGARLSLSMLSLPVAIGLLAVFVLGLSLIVATVNTFFRDCGHLVAVFLQAWYFLTPILFPIDQFRNIPQWRFKLNPAFYFIELFHEILVAGHWPPWEFFAAAAAIASTTLVIGYATFKSQEDKMVFRL
jgi:ABC-2 type transport system permease protein/lipopolysaccharide transport system permease protein